VTKDGDVDYLWALGDNGLTSASISCQSLQDLKARHVNKQNFESLDKALAKKQKEQWQTPQILDMRANLKDTLTTVYTKIDSTHLYYS
jgi:hypothetical protein